jgi:chromosome segregation ATPase
MASPTRLRTIAQELYGLRPEEFTPARTAAEKGARAEGDRELAAAVKALRRPAVAAWAVNLLVRHRAELVDQVVELGDQLRQAQSLLQGEALRELSRQRRQLVTAVASEAGRLTASEGQRLSDAALRQVEDTLQAAMTDRSAAEAVRSGLLAQPLSSTGLASLAEVLAVPLEDSATPEGPPEPARPALSVVRDEDRRHEQAQARVAAAGAAVRAAQKTFDKATKKRSKGEAKVLQLEAELEELRRRVAELEEQTDAAVERLTELDAGLEEAAATLEDARAEATAAATALAELS